MSLRADTIIHHHGTQLEPSHLILLIIGLALVNMATWLLGVHHGKRLEEPPEHPLLDVAPQASPWKADPGMTTSQAAEQARLGEAYEKSEM